MSEKFTPGPWSVGGKTGFLNQIAINPSIGCAYGAGEEVIANARLISAAPDLLEALQAIVKRIEYYTNVGSAGQPNIEDWEYTEGSRDMAKARAAISKATGEKA